MPNQKRRKDVRNLAIVAHVDHRKTTLVDTLLRYTGAQDTAIQLVSPRKISLEFALVFIEDDELVEVTPLNIRPRKIQLKETDRTRTSRVYRAAV